MPEFTQCNGGSCPRKEDCLRFNGKPGPEWELYYNVPPYDYQGATSCDVFIPRREVKVTDIGTYEVTSSTST